MWNRRIEYLTLRSSDSAKKTLHQFYCIQLSQSNSVFPKTPLQINWEYQLSQTQSFIWITGRKAFWIGTKPLRGRLVIPEWRQEPIQLMNCYTNYTIFPARNNSRPWIRNNRTSPKCNSISPNKCSVAHTKQKFWLQISQIIQNRDATWRRFRQTT